MSIKALKVKLREACDALAAAEEFTKRDYDASMARKLSGLRRIRTAHEAVILAGDVLFPAKES